MEDLKSAARLLRWAVQNTLYNLTFIPEDRLGWKPEPAAKSPLEIVGEVVAGQRMMLPVFNGGEWAQTSFPRPTSLEEARGMLEEISEKYLEALENATLEGMDRMVTMAGIPIWAPRAVLLPVVDAIHHHGQLTYIQLLLGDTESHFEMQAAGEFFRRPE